MEVTWGLRPDAVWHDGTPLSAEDVSWIRAGIDPDLFGRGTRVLSQISEVTAPAPQTVVMRWKAVYVLANEMVLDTIVPLPRHLLGPVYDAGDKQAFASSPYLSDEWVGLGPYRLREWQRGATSTPSPSIATTSASRRSIASPFATSATPTRCW